MTQKVAFLFFSGINTNSFFFHEVAFQGQQEIEGKKSPRITAFYGRQYKCSTRVMVNLIHLSHKNVKMNE